MMNGKILVIDDEGGIRSSLKGILEDEGYIVKSIESGEKGLDLLKIEKFDLIILDIWLPQMSGIDVLEKIKKDNGNSQVIMITGHGSVEAAVKATKLGAYDFLEKPLSLEKVVLTVKNALRQKNLEEENIQLREKIRRKYNLIGKSHAIQKLRADIKMAAPTNSSILITGENCTGKKLVARLIHDNSARSNKRFVQINSAAIPEELLEIELFGYTKGALRQTEKEKKGKLFMADGGTLFLDEIGEMSLSTQSKLIDVMEERKFEPIGSDKPIAVDIRFISSSSKNLNELVLKGEFNKDLFFKLNIIPMSIPPLRKRKEDIPLLINYFLSYFSIEYGKKQKTMSPEAMKAFINYSWPGNVSELINVIERFVIMIPDEEIKSSHLYLLVEPRESQHIPQAAENKSLDQARNQFEKKYIHEVLIKNNWNIASAASELKIGRDTLYEKIENLGIRFSE